MPLDDESSLTFDDAVDEEAVISQKDSKIFTSTGDLEIDSLHGKQKRGRLILQPDFQRQYVWDATKASKLIESAILGIPLPVIYLSEEKDGKEYVIDGQQRLTSFFSYIDGRFPDNKPFKLTGLNVYTDLNGKLFKDLIEELQDKVRYYKIRAITFQKDSSKTLKFEIFERLNTGSVQLNDQELRNCLYRGKLNAALTEMAADTDFMHICGLRGPDKRMKDRELVLRFCAFFHKTYLNYKAPMKDFLNAEAFEKRDLSDEELQELKLAFKNTCQIIRSLFDQNAFKRFYKGREGRPNGFWEPKKFNASLYDVLMYSFARENKNHVFQNLDAVREALLVLMTEDQEFVDSIELSTSSVQAVTTRFDKWRTTLQAVLGVQQKEQRCFSYDLKKKMMDADPTCAICGQQIISIDDSAIDHIKQYWMGGKTIPENARLTHRFCNWSRSRNDAVAR